MIFNFNDFITESKYKSSEVESIYGIIINSIPLGTIINSMVIVPINNYGISNITIQPVQEDGWNGFFDSIKSYKSEDGWVLYIFLREIENHTLFHELHHCLQFIKTNGNSHDLYNDFNDIYYQLYFRSSESIRQFEELIYRLTPKESSAHLAELSHMIETDIDNERIDYLIGKYLTIIDIVKNDRLDINFSQLDKKKLSKVFVAIDMEKTMDIKMKNLFDDEEDERTEMYKDLKGTVQHFDKVYNSVIKYLKRRCRILEKKFRKLQEIYMEEKLRAQSLL